MSGAPTAITIEPGALQKVPVMAFLYVARAFGLGLGTDLVIRYEHDPQPDWIEAMTQARGAPQPASLPADVQAVLTDTEKWLIGERDSLYECITDAEGNIPEGEGGNDDAAYLRELDGVIDRIQAVRRKYGGAA